MSAMSQLYADILDLLEQGLHPTKIARQLSIPLPWVYDVLESMKPSEG